MMKWTWKWWFNVFLDWSSEFFILFYFFIFSFYSFYCPFPIKEISIIRLLTTCRRGNKRFDVHLRRVRTVHFLSKDGKSASYDGRDGWKSCLFPARVGISNFDVSLLDSTFPYLYLDLACKQLCFPPGKGINRRNESTEDTIFIYCKVLMIIFQYSISLRCW